MADSKARIGKAQEVPGESHATKEEENVSKGCRRELEGLHWPHMGTIGMLK